MKRSSVGLLLTAACIVTIAGCSSDSGTNNNPPPPPPPPPGSNSGAMTAKINGTSFASVGASFSYTTNTLAIVGLDLTTTITVSLGGITAPGTYPIGVTSPVVIFIVSRSPNSGWDTLGAGATGTVTITSLSATHVAGTFSFSATPQSGTTGAMVVTQGAFDMTK